MSMLTPTENKTLEQKLGGFASLTDGLDYAARGETGFNFYSARGALDIAMPYADLRERALTAARRLKGFGLQRGDRVCVIAETSPEFMAVFFGCQYAGLIPVPLPYSMYIGGHNAYVKRLSGMIGNAGANLVLAPEGLHKLVCEAAELADCDICITHEAFNELPVKRIELEPLTAEDPAYIQYSSGSTSDPKGVMVTQQAIAANARGIHQGMQLTPGERGFSWLPLYHDMGLVGFFLSPLLGQCSIDYLSTPAFARRPLLWLKIMSDNGCAVAFSPSFGYELAVRRLRNELDELDLSKWRIAGIGGDMVRPEILNSFGETFAPAGFDANAFVPSYGMAEATLAVTFPPLDRKIKVDRIDLAQAKMFRRAVPRQETDQDGAVTTRDFVACGKIIDGHELCVRDDHGKELGEREIGHILIKGPSIMGGYFENPAATENVMQPDGWMDTGDMGYLLDGEIVITGRSKDLILHNGRNIWPQDIEWAAEAIAPLRHGDAAAFSIEEDNDERVVVLVQCRTADQEQRNSLRREIGAVIQRHAGVDCNVVLVPPRSLPFTSSGKLSRMGAKTGFLSGQIAEVS
ncbi:MAG: acyl-CoA synthetase [Hyphomicrobiales bacterium]|nr:MAG: acyl-CoA synthetase [Hyphomicrobiales bacterium]